jgi:hypothetical protein
MFDHDHDQDDAPDRSAELAAARAKLPRDFRATDDGALAEALDRAQMTRKAMDYLEIQIDRDGETRMSVSKGAVVLLLQAVEQMEAVLREVTAGGARGPAEIQEAIDARAVEGLLASL